ncbi:MAG: hypothetical protein KKA67_09370 [Spirochaetes bacterium]|nr:hypothetical protein [Spirochaetota bacterium]MBU1080959.1 hypothetical protein [Spirochaetota bacterium]
MIRTPKIALAVLLVQIATAASGYASGADSASGSGYGASGAAAAMGGGLAFTIVDMLRWAVEDEYLARGEYVAIMEKFGVTRPYDNIKASEDLHLAWLEDEYAARGLAFPADGSATSVVAPADLKSAAQAGVDAELSNIGMYKAFLARPELSRPENASVKDLFERLMRASENHLRAFNTQLSKD